MQIYSKSMKNATSPLFRNHNRSTLPAGTYITHRVIYYPLVTLQLPHSRAPVCKKSRHSHFCWRYFHAGFLQAEAEWSPTQQDKRSQVWQMA